MVERARLDYGLGSQGVELLGGGEAFSPFLPCQLAFPQHVHGFNPSYGILGGVEAAYKAAGFRGISVRVLDAPAGFPSAAECVRFEPESFGALHAMLANVSEADRNRAWTEIEKDLRRFEGPDGFVGPCELLVGAARR
jgi:hypothetical protein